MSRYVSPRLVASTMIGLVAAGAVWAQSATGGPPDFQSDGVAWIATSQDYIAVPGGPSPTTMGAPRARASIATWEDGEPAASAMAPPRVQSAARKAEGVMSSPATIEPPEIFAIVSSPLSCASTRSRMSIHVR